MLTAGFFSSLPAVQCVGHLVDFPAGGGTFTWVPHGLKTLRPKEENTTQAQQEDEFHYETFLSEL